MPLELGNSISYGDWYQLADQGIIDVNGRNFVTTIGRGTITDTLQSIIPLRVFAPGKPLTLQARFPDLPFQVPVGGQIVRVDFRLPATLLPQEEPTFALQIPKGGTIVGTTGENLKVSPTTVTTHTVTSPVITSASNAYTPGASAVLSRSGGTGDQVSPSLLTTVAGSPLILGLAVSNAGNTAAGNGIRLSTVGAIAYVFARVIYSIPGDAVNQNFLPFPYAPDVAPGQG